MLILHGIYRFRPKLVAYRNDFCLTCASPRRAYRTRTFDVVHIFFIPLVPLGFLRRWHCAVCENDPHVHPGTRRSLKWAGVFLLALLAVGAWLVPDRGALAWTFRIVLPIAFAAALLHTARSKPDTRLSDKLREIMAADETTCPVCDTPLMIDSNWRCPHCGIERTVVEV